MGTPERVSNFSNQSFPICSFRIQETTESMRCSTFACFWEFYFLKSDLQFICNLVIPCRSCQSKNMFGLCFVRCLLAETQVSHAVSDSLRLQQRRQCQECHRLKESKFMTIHVIFDDMILLWYDFNMIWYDIIIIIWHVRTFDIVWSSLFIFKMFQLQSSQFGDS